MPSVPPRAAATTVLAFILVLFPLGPMADWSTASGFPESYPHRSTWVSRNNLGAFVRKQVDGRVVCLEAGTEQANIIRDRDQNLPLALLESDPSRDPEGLRIILRGTTQLRGFPMASAAFERAAARWEALIQTRVTIVIDVDFGPSLFGEPFGENVLGSTDTQVLQGNALYPAVRAGLISRAIAPQRASLLNSLHAKAVSTDRGDSAGIAASSATLRTLDLIDQTADPEGEFSDFGLPPAIGVNSQFNFDFEPADGIAPDKLDFEAIVLHEIGHVLGFISCVGQHEIDPSTEVGSSILDLFRVRPDAIESGFAAAQRILASGGEQSFYAGNAALSLSTGRPDGTGGDGRQAAHWKDDNLTGLYMGVMDPTIGPGDFYFITDNDTAALEAIGYRTLSVTQPATLIPLVSGRPQAGGMISPPAGLGFLSHLQYSIDVPARADQLQIELNGNQDVDLFVRFGERVVIQSHQPASDYVSANDSGFEAITITPASSPSLRSGTYFIAVVNFGPGEADFTVTATVGGVGNSRAPAIFDINPRLEGDILDLTYAAIDLEGDAVQADVTLLDEAGRPIGQPTSSAIGAGDSIRIAPRLSIGGLSAVPHATGAGLVLVDRDGNRSPEATIDFSRAEAGGLTVSSASFDGSRLKIKTSGSSENPEVEINGRVVAPPRAIKIKAASGKLVVKGNAGQLGLLPGANRIRVKNARGWSNILIMDT